jgi:VIT1/CCC1 family predicted Fe2+/Mn2+ transporter
LLLVAPYFILSSVNAVNAALLAMLAVTVFIIAAYTYYMSIVKDEPFLHRFGEMAAISLGVAAISYAIGWLLKTYLGVEV